MWITVLTLLLYEAFALLTARQLYRVKLTKVYTARMTCDRCKRWSHCQIAGCDISSHKTPDVRDVLLTAQAWPAYWSIIAVAALIRRVVTDQKNRARIAWKAYIQAVELNNTYAKLHAQVRSLELDADRMLPGVDKYGYGTDELIKGTDSFYVNRDVDDLRHRSTFR